MKTNPSFLLTASMALALVFTFSCSSDSNDAPLSASSSSGGSEALPSSSSSGGIVRSSSSSEDISSSSSDGTSSSSSDGTSSSSSSSSSVASSSSGEESLCADFDGMGRLHYGMMKEQFCDERDGKIYVYKDIGTQTWMAENLNYNASGSVCYNNNSSNCDTYGRLYDWATANAVCPAGWHLPTRDEWDVLSNYVGGSSVEGRHLKATSGWNENGNGLDTYGFAALPGGGGYSGGSFYNVGNYGLWWTASENGSYDAYGRRVDCDFEDALWRYNGKLGLFSVRCAQDVRQ